MTYRIRIRKPNGSTLVIDKTHSQICEYLQGSREKFRRFLAGVEVTAANGDAVKFIDYV